jgi:uncharacterized protein (DUF488 family)
LSEDPGFAAEYYRQLQRIVVYTVGYEGRTVAELLDLLRAAEVTRLVDVRELPLSRRPGLSKTALGGLVAEVGIEYVHVRALGNPKENRDRYRSGDVVGGAEVYRRHLGSNSYEALVDLAESLDDGVTCLLCVERDHAVCHREVIADGLRGLRVALNVCHL